MKRLGFYTGRVYDESVDVKDIKECCLVFESGNEEFVMRKSEELKRKHCIGCFECGEAAEERRKNWGL